MRLVALFFLTAFAVPAPADAPSDYCLAALAERPTLRKDPPQAPLTGREPYTVPELSVEIRIPVEGRVRFTDLATGHISETWFPSGDDPLHFSYFDAPSGRLYGSSYSAGTGWVKLRQGLTGWEVADTGMVRPLLQRTLRSWTLGATARFSPLLRKGFYNGYTAPWCCAFLRRQRTYEFDLADGIGRPIPDLWWRQLEYRGDDPVESRAVLRDRETGDLYWHDGTSVASATPGETGPLLPWTIDPLTDGQLLRDGAGQPHRFDGTTVMPLDSAGVLDEPVTWLGYRPAFGRWIIATRKGWYEYRLGQSLHRLNMPTPVVTGSWDPKWIDIPPGFDRWIIARGGLWWEEAGTATPVAMLPEGRVVAGPATVGATAAGRTLAFALVNDPGSNSETWLALSPKTNTESCASPETLSSR